MSENIPEQKIITAVASHLEVIGDPTRLTILYALADHEQCVTELSEITGFSLPAVSHHLRILKDKGFVIKRKQGIKVYYQLVDSCIRQVIAIARGHIEENHGYSEALS